MPTGGVSVDNVVEFVRAGSFAVGAGADLVDLARIRAGEPGAVTEKARRYVAAVKAAREGAKG